MRIDPKLISEFIELIEAAERIVIGTHLNPDGDALGSALGLALFLEHIGKSVEVLCHHEPPKNLEFLPTVRRVRQQPLGDAFDLAIMVDLEVKERLGTIAEFLATAPKLIVIDHHVPHECPGDLRIIDVGAAATSLILTELFLAMEAEITDEIATCLYTGISTDTGSFRYRNTSSDALRAAALLVDAGANHEKVSEHVFQSKSLASMRLLGHCLETMKLDMEDRIVWSALSVRDFEWAAARDEHTEGFVNELLSIDTALVAAVLRETAPGKIRCSLRSRGNVDIAEVARKFSGGGHRNAAGCTFTGTLEEAEDELITELRKCLESS